MADARQREQWAADASLLGRIGRQLATVPLPTVSVRLPAELAERAVAAWDRDDGGGDLGPEDTAAWLTRHRAASFALIGLAVRERGRRDGDDVVVELGVELIVNAADAAEELGA